MLVVNFKKDDLVKDINDLLNIFTQNIHTKIEDLNKYVKYTGKYDDYKSKYNDIFPY